MKTVTCTCINSKWNVDKLINIVDNAKRISKKRFLTFCEIDDDLKKEIRQFPGDFQYFQNKEIFFFEHSRIEHFYE